MADKASVRDKHLLSVMIYVGSQSTGGSDSKESACSVGDLGSIPGSGRFPWRRECLPTPVFLTGESHRQRSLAIYNPWGRKESDMTEQLSMHTQRLGFPKDYGRLYLLREDNIKGAE